MKLSFPESDIQHLADRYEKALNEEELNEEKELLALRSELESRQDRYLTKSELVKILKWKWKPGRPATLAKENSDEMIIKITSNAFCIADVYESLRILTVLKGVGEPMASAVLHLCHKDPYPIWDWRARESVGIPEDRIKDYWRQYVDYCRDLVSKNSVDMRTLDRALWQYSRENQK